MSAKTYARITPELTKRFHAYYLAHPSNWGSLHIVLDDDNIETHSVEFCRGWAREHDDPEGEELATILLELSTSQRRRLGDLASMPRFTSLEVVQTASGPVHIARIPSYLRRHPQAGERIWLDGVRRRVREVKQPLRPDVVAMMVETRKTRKITTSGGAEWWATQAPRTTRI
jgi:hypothetical protein